MAPAWRSFLTTPEWPLEDAIIRAVSPTCIWGGGGRDWGMSHTYNIIESVDYICRDSAYVQYTIIQKISQNVNNGQLINAFRTTYDSSLSVFIVNKTTSGAKKHRKHQTWKSPNDRYFPFFFLIFFRQASSKLRDFHDGLCTKQNFTLTSVPVYGFICNAILFTCTHVHKALSNEM